MALYSDVKWTFRRLKSAATQLLVLQLVHANNNALHHWPFVRESTGDQWIPSQEPVMWKAFTCHDITMY